jgi:cation:H+ antiporter
MTSTEEDVVHGESHAGRNRLYMAMAFLVTVPGLYLRLTETHISDPIAALLFGLAIVGSAFLLSWAAEVAQLDISAGLAIAVLAFIAVLPEYAVDLVFARKGGNAFEQFGRSCQSAADKAKDVESSCSLALANMTGANRLLIGIGWTMVVFIAWYRFRKRGRKNEGVSLERSHSVELSYLALATLYSLTLPLKSSITLVDAAVLVAIFIAYTIRISRAPAEEPHLVGPATLLAGLRVGFRRASVILFFLAAAGVILLCAEHFAEALVDTGASFNISEFLLVQWLAPLASEAPELLVAGLFAWRLNTNAGLGTLVSSKVNQWTLLVGTLPIAFALSAGTLHGLPIVATQREELLLTAAQSVFAVAILFNLQMSNREAQVLFGLFWAQFIVGALVPENLHQAERVGVAIVYILMGVFLILKDRGPMRRLLKDGFRTPYSQLDDAAAQ